MLEFRFIILLNNHHHVIYNLSDVVIPKNPKVFRIYVLFFSKKKRNKIENILLESINVYLNYMIQF